MVKITKDLSSLTTIPEKTLDKLSDKILYCICEGVLEDIMDEQDVSEFDFFGLFTLYIKHEGGTLKYRVVPTDKLDSVIKGTAENKLNLLEDTLNNSLVAKFTDLYKELC